MKMLLAYIYLFAAIASNFRIINGHGGMYYPWTWTATTTPTPDVGPSWKNFKFEIPIPIPDEHCEKETAVNPAGCKFKMGSGLPDWFTNYTRIPGEATMPDYMQDQFIKPTKKNPWAAPGTAPIYGEGCGVNGGNPNGCGYGNLYGNCCARDCGGYEGGKSALEYAKDGLFDNAPVVEWKRGQPADVYWTQTAEHRGGYAYRLCKVPLGGISEVTEACFNEGHLDFYGNTTWIYREANKNFDPKKWEAVTAVRTKEGTYPPGSEWTKMELPIAPQKPSIHWAFKDLVQVPDEIETGDYVLSFRWDCQRSPQIWSSCANIKVV